MSLSYLSFQRPCDLTVAEKLVARADDSDTVSLETLDAAVSPIATLIARYPETFFRLLRCLDPVDADVLLAYTELRKTQKQIGALYGRIQSFAGLQIHAAMLRLSLFIFAGVPLTADGIRPILISAGLEKPNDPVSLAAVICEYASYRNWDEVQESLSLNAVRPNQKHYNHSIRMWRTRVRDAKSKLHASTDIKQQALGAYLDGLIGAGLTQRIMSAYRHRATAIVRATTPAILGQFRVDVSDPNFNALFAVPADGPRD